MKACLPQRSFYKRSGRSLSVLTFALLVFQVLYLPPGLESGTEIAQAKLLGTTPVVQGSSLADDAWNRAEILVSAQTSESNVKAVQSFKVAALAWEASGKLDLAARSLLRAAEIYQNLGDLKNALASLQDGLVLSRKGKSSIEEGKLLNGLAYNYFLEGDSKASRTNSLAALNLGRSIGNKQIEAGALSNLAESYFSTGDLTAAQKHQLEACNLWRELDDSKNLALSEIALGYYNANLSEPRRAFELLEQALASAQQSKDVRAQALAWNALANVKAKFDRKQESLDAYARAQPLAERVGDRLFLASILAGRGALYLRLGDTERALQYTDQATNLFHELNAKWGTAETKLQLGRIHHSLGNDDRAIECLNEALSLFHALAMQRLEVQTLLEIGVVQTAKGQLNEALSTLQKSLKLNRSGQDYRHEANALNLMGNVYENLKQLDRAKEFYLQALPIGRTAEDPAIESNSLFNLAHLECNRENLVDAESHLKRAIDINESIRSGILSRDLRASYFVNVHQMYALYVDVLMRRDKVQRGAGFAELAFSMSERARARGFLESLQEGQVDVREGVDPALLEQEHSLQERLNAKAERQLKLLAEKKTLEADQLRIEIDALTAEYSTARDRIRATSPRYASLTMPEPLDLKEIQHRLMDDESMLLEYSLGEERSYAWLVSRDELQSFELAPRKVIEESAKKLYNELIANQAMPGESVEQHSQRQKKAAELLPGETAELSKMVLGPLTGKLSKKRIVIISDGALQYIPFQVLNYPESDQTSPKPLIEKYEIGYQLSASTLAMLLQEANQRKEPRDSVAVMADPVFEVDDPRITHASQNSTPESPESLTLKQALRDIGISADGVAIPRLVASSEEADAIMNSAPWGTGFKAVGFEATRQMVVEQTLTGYRIVHFATHGLINNEHPELSGIVLSLFDKDGRSQNGFLRLHDIYNMHLPADLVVLSACSTGLGKEVRGEGLIGLTRGFMYAGASGVVASLWKVDDRATAELMKLFYEGLFRKGLTPIAALREAQLKMAQQKAWESPYYWAGFVIQGRYDEHLDGKRVRYLTKTRIATFVGVSAALLTTLLVLRKRRHFI